MQDRFRQALRAFANSVTVITTAHAGARFGFTSTAVCCIAVEEPTLLVCVNRGSSSHDPMLEARSFCVNVLRESQVEIAKRFTGFYGHKGEARFAGAQWEALETGAPVLAGGLAAFDCRVAEAKAWRTHTMFFGTVVAIGAERGIDDPLLYANRDYAALRAIRPGS